MHRSLSQESIVVDEAHCIKKWCLETVTCYLYQSIYCFLLYRGSMFRCEYSQLGDIRNVIPDEVHVIALTATRGKKCGMAAILAGTNLL